MKFNDAVFGALCMGLGVLVLWHVQSFPAMPGQKYGPAVFPGLIAAGFITCGAILVVRGARGTQPLATVPTWMRSGPLVARFFCVVAAMGAYALLSPILGFLLTACGLLVILFVVFGVNPTRAALVALVATGVIHFLFYKVMRVPLPWGVLTPIAW
jgi:putative tricarboxylic transport membrane protein